MRASISDSGALTALGHLDVAAYLRSRGWRREDTSFSRYLAVWTYTDRDGIAYEANVPTDPDIRDYAARAAEVLAVLEAVEGRSQTEVYRDITHVSCDVIRVRLPVPSVDDAIAIQAGVSLVTGVRSMMEAAACAALEPRPVYGPRKADKVEDYLRQVRLGQTESGSYVLTVLSPVAPELTPQLVLAEMPEEDPFQRQVVRTLVQATAAMASAARAACDTGRIDAFDAAVAAGVSANLCEAVNEIGSQWPGADVEVGVSWAPSRPGPTHISGRTRLTRDALATIAEAAREFRKRRPRPSFRAKGQVMILDRTQDQPATVIFAEVDGVVRKIRVQLSDADHGKAQAAYRDDLVVGCSGELVLTGRQYQLQDPHDFAIEDR